MLEIFGRFQSSSVEQQQDCYGSKYLCSPVLPSFRSFFFSRLIPLFFKTPFWMAPEVIRGTGHGRSADIWSLACTIIEMATGRPPFNQFEPQQALFQIAKGMEPEYPSHLSPEGIEFLKSCFQRDPKNRPTSLTLLNYPFVKDINFISK
jgi:serine/threonine protein kinase